MDFQIGNSFGKQFILALLQQKRNRGWYERTLGPGTAAASRNDSERATLARLA